jgi:phosphate transport system permease protein
MREFQTSDSSYSDASLTKELLTPLPPRRQIVEYVMNGIAYVFSVLAMVPLFSILWEIVFRGASGLKPEMFWKSVTEFGFANAILGTVTMVAIGSIISIPIGLMTGILLSEFSQKNRFADTIRFIGKILTGVPSIVVGIFAYGVFFSLRKGLLGEAFPQFSSYAGGFALAVIILPIVALTTEEALKLVPKALRLGSAALGGNSFQTTFRVVVSAALPAITTGVLLGLARAAGETAPLIFTALFSLDWVTGLDQPTASLPVLIYNLYNDPDPQRNALVWTTSLVLVGLVMVVSLISRVATSKKY